MIIRNMTLDDVPEIAELEKICFSDPWSEKSVASELENRLSYWLVAEDNNAIVGYVGSQSVLDSADIMNVAVAPGYRRQGIGEQLIESLSAHLRDKNIAFLMLEVRVSNEAAISLYKKLGFVQVGCRPRYYTKPREDALILRKELAK